MPICVQKRMTHEEAQTNFFRARFVQKVVQLCFDNHPLYCKDAMRPTAISTHPFADATLISEALNQTFKQHFDVEYCIPVYVYFDICSKLVSRSLD